MCSMDYELLFERVCEQNMTHLKEHSPFTKHELCTAPILSPTLLLLFLKKSEANFYRVQKLSRMFIINVFKTYGQVYPK